MKKYLQKKLNNEKGMTLIELLAVIVIIAIIAAIAIPAIGNIIENSRYSAVKSDALNTLNAANIYFAENADKTVVTIEDLKKGYLEDSGSLIVGAENKVVKVDGAVALNHGTIVYSGAKTIAFNEATIEIINNDTQKGSEDSSAKTIPTSSPTPTEDETE